MKAAPNFTQAQQLKADLDAWFRTHDIMPRSAAVYDIDCYLPNLNPPGMVIECAGETGSD